MKTLILLCALTISGLAHASAAASYTCAGFVGGLPKDTSESIAFDMIGANDGITMHINSLSDNDLDPKNADLTVDKTCKFTMDPDPKYPAYDVTAVGTCGTKVKYNFTGVCFFDY